MGSITLKKFTTAKAGDTLTLQTKALFEDDHDLISALKITPDEAPDPDIEVAFTIDEINEIEPAVLNQELFDKLYGENNITSEAELRTRVKEDIEKQFAQQSEQQLLKRHNKSSDSTYRF